MPVTELLLLECLIMSTKSPTKSSANSSSPKDSGNDASPVVNVPGKGSSRQSSVAPSTSAKRPAAFLKWCTTQNVKELSAVELSTLPQEAVDLMEKCCVKRISSSLLKMVCPYLAMYA